MAGGRRPGPQCSYNDPVDIEDGTTCVAQSPTPGPLGTAAIPSSYGARAECVQRACSRAIQLAPGALERQTGYALGDVLKALIPDLVQTLMALTSTTASGAMTLRGFARASPSARIDGRTDILRSLGLDFLAEPMRGSLGEMICVVQMGISRADGAGNCGTDRDLEIERAAEELALGAAILVRLILQGIVANLLDQAATEPARRTVSDRQGVGIRGTKTIDDNAVGQIVSRLRSSKLDSGFAAWVERNWKDLLKNPRLRTMPSLQSGAISASAQRLSPGRKPPAPAAPLSQSYSDPPTFSPDVDPEAQAATLLVAAAAQGKPFCPE